MQAGKGGSSRAGRESVQAGQANSPIPRSTPFGTTGIDASSLQEQLSHGSHDLERTSDSPSGSTGLRSRADGFRESRA